MLLRKLQPCWWWGKCYKQKFILKWCQCTNVIYKRKSFYTMWSLRCINVGDYLKHSWKCTNIGTISVTVALQSLTHYLFLTHLLSSNSALNVWNVYAPFCGRFESNPTFNRHLSDTVGWRLDYATAARFLSLKTEISEQRPFWNALEKPTV